jgi:hypothetical protein
MSTHSRLSRALHHLRGVLARAQLRMADGSGAPAAGLVDGCGASSGGMSLASPAGSKAARRALGTSGRALLLVVLSCGALLVLGGGVASAKIAHKSEGSFEGSETLGGSFGYLLALSVDNSTGPSAGDVYVGGLSFSNDSGYVYKFDANGKYTGVELNGSETPGGSFAFLSFSASRASRGLAVDSSSGANKGDVYVADAEHLVVDRFSESGKFICQITGREYASLSTTEQEHECAGAAGSKTPQGGFTEGSDSEGVLGVAVDPLNGDVYASDPGHAVIDEFNEAGKYIGQISDSHIVVPGPLAFTSAGELYVDNGGLTSPAEVVKFDASGFFAAVLDSGEAGYVAVNPSNDSVFVLDGGVFGESETAEYDPSGNINSKFGTNESGAIGVSASSGRIYLGPVGSGSVSMYGPAVMVPDVAATAATGVEQFTATLDGTVGPAGGGSVESCEFEYGTSTSYGQTAPCSPATPYAGVTNVSAGLSALSPEITYHFRVAASNSNGIVSYSSDETLTTAALAVSGQATKVTASSATLGGTVDPDGATITECHFEYGTTGGYGESQPCASTPSGSSPVAVSAEITGLSENTTYHYRLVAAYSDGSNSGSDAGTDETFTTLSRPLIGTAYTTNLTESSVDLNAEINPKGLDTTYHFEWGTSAGYGNSVPVPDADISSGSSDVLVSQRLSGLSANTTYHWRVVATNSIGTKTGTDHTFVYQPPTSPGVGCPNEQLRAANALSLLLPDCRAYEQVSPVDKNESDVTNAFEGSSRQQVSVDGERVFYEAIGALPGSPEGITVNQYVASRGASGWSTRPVDLPLTAIHGPGGPFVEYSLPLSPDLSTGLINTADQLVAGAPGPESWNLYVGHLLTGSYELVTDVNPPNQRGNNFKVIPVAASTDFSHVVFYANDALTPEAPRPNSFGTNLYEWVEGQLHLVGLIPTSGTSCTGAECTPADEEEAGGRNFESPQLTENAISADGSRIVFSTGQEETEKHIYDRLNGTTTVDVSASQRTPAEPGTTGAHYQDASVDGSHVLFTSEGALTNDAVPGSGENLYDYDVETGQLTDLTAADDARVAALAGVSEDASHVYFVAEGVLAANSNSHGDTAVAGQPNLYLWNGGQTTFIATTFITEERGSQPTRVTPDGAHLAFDSTASLTGYDNTVSDGGNCGYLGLGGPQLGTQCTEVFLYDAAANRLICASCNPSGARPIGPSDLHWLGSAVYRPRNLSADGSRLFFTSRDALLPEATNGLWNVYEWEADGSGSCQSSADNSGCLYLISDGSSASNSYFADASASGNDAFFQTGASLVGQDEDSYEDLYDARVGGGFSSQDKPVVAPACTSLEGCLSPLSEPPAQLSVASAELHGSGNLLTPPEAPTTVVKKTAAQIRAEKFTKALKACKKEPKKKRAKCRKQANKSFGKAK